MRFGFWNMCEKLQLNLVIIFEFHKDLQHYNICSSFTKIIIGIQYMYSI